MFLLFLPIIVRSFVHRPFTENRSLESCFLTFFCDSQLTVRNLWRINNYRTAKRSRLIFGIDGALRQKLWRFRLVQIALHLASLACVRYINKAACNAITIKTVLLQCNLSLIVIFQQINSCVNMPILVVSKAKIVDFRAKSWPLHQNSNLSDCGKPSTRFIGQNIV